MNKYRRDILKLQMNSLSYYDRSKVPWTEEEAEEIKKEYETELLNIIQIGDKHKRTPGGIAYKLKSDGIVVHNALTRGYTEYIKSNLYEEICKDGKKEDAVKKQKKEELAKRKEETTEIKKLTFTDVVREIRSLKDEISEMKKDIKQVLSFMTSIYDFETKE